MVVRDGRCIAAALFEAVRITRTVLYSNTAVYSSMSTSTVGHCTVFCSSSLRTNTLV